MSFAWIIVPVVAIAIWLAMRQMLRRGAAEQAASAEADARVNAMTLQDAAAAADRLLADAAVFRCVIGAAGSDAPFDTLAPEVRRVLGRFEVIELLRHPYLHLERRDVGPSAHKPGMLRIGRVEAGSDMEAEVAVKPGDETVYELHEGESLAQAGRYASIHHCLLAMATEGR